MHQFAGNQVVVGRACFVAEENPTSVQRYVVVAHGRMVDPCKVNSFPAVEAFQGLESWYTGTPGGRQVLVVTEDPVVPDRDVRRVGDKNSLEVGILDRESCDRDASQPVIIDTIDVDTVGAMCGINHCDQLILPDQREGLSDDRVLFVSARPHYDDIVGCCCRDCGSDGRRTAGGAPRSYAQYRRNCRLGPEKRTYRYQQKCKTNLELEYGFALRDDFFRMLIHKFPPASRPLSAGFGEIVSGSEQLRVCDAS
jgi:hypothetical protein